MDETINEKARPCSVTSGFTYCCDVSAVCLEGGFCLQDLQPVRGTCTDKNWSDASCPNWCDKREPDFSPGYVILTPC